MGGDVEDQADHCTRDAIGSPSLRGRCNDISVIATSYHHFWASRASLDGIDKVPSAALDGISHAALHYVSHCSHGRAGASRESLEESHGPARATLDHLRGEINYRSGHGKPEWASYSFGNSRIGTCPRRGAETIPIS